MGTMISALILFLWMCSSSNALTTSSKYDFLYPNRTKISNSVVNNNPSCVVCEEMKVCSVLNGLMVQISSPTHINSHSLSEPKDSGSMHSGCGAIETQGKNLHNQVFGVDKSFKHSEYCQDMVMQYLCLNYGSNNDMYQNECFLKKSFVYQSPRSPCRSFCSQVAMECANDRHAFLQTCQDIECPVVGGVGCDMFHSSEAATTTSRSNDPALHFSVTIELFGVTTAQSSSLLRLDSAAKSTLSTAVALILAVEPTTVSLSGVTSLAVPDSISISMDVIVPNSHHLDPPPMELYTSMSVALTAAVGKSGELVKKIDLAKVKSGSDLTVARSSMVSISEALFYSPCLSLLDAPHPNIDKAVPLSVFDGQALVDNEKGSKESNSFVSAVLVGTAWCLIMFLVVRFVQRTAWMYRGNKSSAGVGATTSVTNVYDNSV